MPSNDGDKDEIRKAENVVKMKLRVMVGNFREEEEATVQDTSCKHRLIQTRKEAAEW